MFFLIFFLELEGINLGQCIVDVVERYVEDVVLFLLEVFGVQKIVFIIILLWQVFLFNLVLVGIVFFWCDVWVFVYKMLEFIYGYIVGEKVDSVCEVAEFVFFSICFEEGFYLGLGEEFYVYRVDFIGFCGGLNVFFNVLILVVVYLKGMAGFVGQYVDIVVCVIEVGKDEWCFVVVDEGVVFFSGFVGVGFQVYEFGFLYKVEKLMGFW